MFPDNEKGLECACVELIEVKRGGLSLRDYCQGIGQLAYQEVMAMSYFQARVVRKVLAAPGPFSPDLVFACVGADVEMLPTMTMRQWRDWCVEIETARCRPN